MRLDQELAQPSRDRDSALTIGVLDGVHRGHHHLIGRLICEAKSNDLVAVVVTFRNHPGSVLRQGFKPRYLSGLDDRINLIGQRGVELVVPVTFDMALSKLRARDFVASLQRHLGMRALVVGPDFALGHNREGDVETLAAYGKEMGFTVTVVDLLMDGGQPVRSTVIREALAQGDVGRVAALLGRNFTLGGTVTKGVGRGRRLGFPTANLEAPPDMAIPGDGIYAAWARLGAERFMAATSIGTRPTFGEGARTIEAYILDFDGDVYDHEISLEFVALLRAEAKYDTIEALQEQVERDVRQTRTILQVSGANPLPSTSRSTQ